MNWIRLTRAADLLWRVTGRLYDRYLESDYSGDFGEAVESGLLVTAAKAERSAPHLHYVAVMLWDRTDTRPGDAK